MINIRKYNPQTDYEHVQKLCDENKIAFPNENLVLFVAEDNGQIVAISGLKKEIKVEPLIANNPVIANNLGKMMEAIAIFSDVNSLYANVDKSNEKHINQLEKAGFEIIETNKVILQKRY